MIIIEFEAGPHHREDMMGATLVDSMQVNRAIDDCLINHLK